MEFLLICIVLTGLFNSIVIIAHLIEHYKND